MRRFVLVLKIDHMKLEPDIDSVRALPCTVRSPRVVPRPETSQPLLCVRKLSCLRILEVAPPSPSSEKVLEFLVCPLDAARRCACVKGRAGRGAVVSNARYRSPRNLAS